MLIKNVKVFTKDKSFKKTDIATAGVRIAECSGDEQVLDAKGLIAIPGLIDIHFHGAMGHDFCNATLEGLYQIAGYEAEKRYYCHMSGDYESCKIYWYFK